MLHDRAVELLDAAHGRRRILLDHQAAAQHIIADQHAARPQPRDTQLKRFDGVVLVGKVAQNIQKDQVEWAIQAFEDAEPLALVDDQLVGVAGAGQVILGQLEALRG